MIRFESWDRIPWRGIILGGLAVMAICCVIQELLSAEAARPRIRIRK